MYSAWMNNPNVRLAFYVLMAISVPVMRDVSESKVSWSSAVTVFFTAIIAAKTFMTSSENKEPVDAPIMTDEQFQRYLAGTGMSNKPLHAEPLK